jgi:anti-sigma regulatory factor (Ser/Thr protein kinase)
LAVSEAVTNAVLHAYRGEGEGLVWVRAEVEDDAVRIAVADRGKGMRTKSDAVGGLGLSLIEQMADAVAVESSGRGVQIEMRFARHCGH